MTVKTLTVSGLNVAAQVLGGTGLTSSTTNGVTTLSVSGSQSFSGGLTVSAGGMAIGTSIDNDVPLKIGTVTSTSQIGLHLASATGAHLQFTDTGNVDMSIGVLDGQSGLSFHTGRNRTAAGTELMRLTSAGNVGIGTSTPATTLEIAGTGFAGLQMKRRTDAPEISTGLYFDSVAASGTITLSGTTLTVVTTTGGAWAVGQVISGSSITSTVTITALIPTTGGTGGNGTYTVTNSTSQTISGTAVAATGINPGGNNYTIRASFGGLDFLNSSAVNVGGGGSKVYFSSAGNVGIGTISPGGKLHVVGDSYLGASSNTTLLLRNLSGENRIDSYNYPITANYPLSILGSYISFVTNDIARIRIDNSGNVGVGTSSPRNLLELAASTVAASSSTTLRIGGIVSTYTAGNYLAVGQEVNRHSIVFSSWRDAQTDTLGAKIQAINYTSYASGGGTNFHLVQTTDLAFYTLGVMPTTTDATVERMRITSAGNVGIGTTDPKSTLHVSGSQSVKVSLALATATTLDATHYIITTPATGNIGYTFPSAATAANRVYMIKRLTTGTVIITPASGDSIETGAANATFSIPAQYDSYTFVSDGTSKWYII